MSFLLDANVCSAHMRRPSGLAHRFIQHSGRLHINTIVLAELFVWGERSKNPSRVSAGIAELLRDVSIIDFDTPSAQEFARVKVSLATLGIAVPLMDLLIASTAIAHDLTLVTHNVADFQNIPGLRVVDWLES